MRHIEGEDRSQVALLPESLEDFVDANHPVRVIDAFVDSLDLQALGFDKAIPKETGRKPYHPGDLLKLYIYGYLNKVMSSRRLEQESQRNVELMWLLKRLRPDFKTVSNFRKDNGSAIKGACRAFVQMCRQAKLLSGELVAIDGSKFQASASIDRSLNRKQLTRNRSELDQDLQRYLSRLDAIDKLDGHVGDLQLQREQVQATLKRLKARQTRLDEYEQAMSERGTNQYCATEPDAKIMRAARGGHLLGYNVQTAVEANNGIIVCHEVTDESGDSRLLEPMAKQAKDSLQVERLSVLADAGYSNGEHLADCERDGITATTPRRGLPNDSTKWFTRSDFYYDERHDHYVCPAGEVLSHKKSLKTKNRIYTRKGCIECPIKSKCTPAENRTISRHQYEASLERSETRLKADPSLMTKRMAIVERPFAMIKQSMGLRRFQCRGIEKTRTEMAIAVLAYNLQNMIHRLGVQRMLQLVG